MVTPEEVDDELKEEVTSECSKYGSVSKVVIFEEKNDELEVVIKIFVLFASSTGM